MKNTLDSFIKTNTKKRKNSEGSIEEKTHTTKKSNSKTKKTSIIKEEDNKTPISENTAFFKSYDIFINELSTWKEPLKDFIQSPNNKTMQSIYNYVRKEYQTQTIFPPKEQIFNAFKETPFDKIKAVIIGQDPYPTPGNAMGLCFSVPRTQKIPESLKNIYGCLEGDKNLNFKRPNHGDLTSWAKQGVFLINATLTVRKGQANSHQKDSGWGKFTDFVISAISKQKKNIVFLLWGNFAIKKKSLINMNNHLIIQNIHPSPLAQAKGNFKESKQFSECNKYLKEHNIEEIDWTIN